jgi:DNA invertase Pin-like site-specific DNA recombinase
MMMSSEKIQPEHLARTAFVYVRQSTLGQVRDHHESRRRQYELADHARRLGWTDVVVIDEDLGKSGATAAGRPGFQRLVADVSLGRAGAVMGLEVSRLARNNRDWYQLLDLCGLMATLIIDADGIYDPRHLNDRLLLGLKGTMSEAELGWLRQRAWEALLAKARRGELRLGLPAGYVRTHDGQMEKHPDERVQHALGLVFDKFAELGSVHRTVQWFRHAGLALPANDRDPAWGVRLTWRLPVYNTIRNMLRNPVYAGAYAFGRTVTRTRVVDGVPYKSRCLRRDRQDWIALFRDRHASYISWEVYERNQQLIAHNAQQRGGLVRGPAREGVSLVAGLLRCGHCGRRLHVTYGGAPSIGPRYQCSGAARNHGAARCIAFGGLRVDLAIEREILRVVTPGAIEAALAHGSDGTEATTAARRALELELQQARYEAERVRRQYDAVEPEHRLVAGTLERRWNAALASVQELEQRLATVVAEHAAHPAPDRARLLALAEDLPRIWADPATDVRSKKRIVRLLVEEIIARAPATVPPQVELIVHWKGGTHTRLVVLRNRSGQHRRSTAQAVVEVVRDLARSLPDAEIARVLNRLGYHTGAGNTWTHGRVTALRNHQGIAVFTPALDHANRLTLADAAKRLGVSTAAARRLVTRGLLPATQAVPYAPWSIRADALDTEAVQQAVNAVQRGQALPRTPAPNQLTIENSTT